KGKRLKRGVTPEIYREVQLRELEHLVDFSYAFQVGPVALAAAVNGIAANKYDTKTGPIKALVAYLSESALVLIPADPYMPEAWTDRMSIVMSQVAGESKLRDSKGTHSPKDNKATVVGDAVVIHPVFGKDSLNTADIIKLDSVDSVYTGAS